MDQISVCVCLLCMYMCVFLRNNVAYKILHISLWLNQIWWSISIIPALGVGLKQEDHSKCKFKATTLYMVSSRPVELHEKTVSKELKTNSLEECFILQIKSSLLLFALFFHFQNEYIKISATNINHNSIFLSTNKL